MAIRDSQRRFSRRRWCDPCVLGHAHQGLRVCRGPPLRPNASPVLTFLSIFGLLLVERPKGLYNIDDQCPQVVEREFREVTLRMDHAKPALADDHPGLVFRDAAPLVDAPGNEGFPPGIDEFRLLMIDNKT